MDSEEGATAAKKTTTRGKAAVVKEEMNSRNKENNNNDEDDDDDDDVQIISPQRGRNLAPIKSAPSKAVTSASTSSSSSSSSSSARTGAGGKTIQKGDRSNPTSARASRKNISDDEVENDEDDNWSGRQKSREVCAY